MLKTAIAIGTIAQVACIVLLALCTAVNAAAGNWSGAAIGVAALILAAS